MMGIKGRRIACPECGLIRWVRMERLVAAEKAGPAYFCDCSVGWQKEIYESVLGKTVDVVLKESVLRGGKRPNYDAISIAEARLGLIEHRLPEAIMVEPTETENIDTLDAFADALIKIAEEARTQPDLLHNAPSATHFGTICG